MEKLLSQGQKLALRDKKFSAIYFIMAMIALQVKRPVDIVNYNYP